MERYLALKASAGSGKTFALTVRYISLLLFDVSPKEILTLTFTNKAATEMSARIYKTLFNLGNDEAVLNSIIEQTSLTKKEILAKKDKIIKNFISSPLSIYTIDKFINKILREFTGYAGVSDDFVIEYDDEELLLYKFLLTLDEKQFDHLIHFAYTQNKRLSSIIELFKKLNEKNEIVEIEAIDMQKYNVTKTNIINNANEIKEFVNNTNLSNSAKKAVDFDDIDSLLIKGKTWLSKDTLQEFTYFKKATISNDLEDIFNELKHNIADYYQIKEQIILKHLFDIFDDFKNFRDKYNKKKNTLEFNDITNIVYNLLQKHIDRKFLYFRLDANYTSILIDEFQDTSVLQYKIVEPLIQEIMTENDYKLKTFFYVGDTKQSIYRFRGGTKELFDYVANQFKGTLKVQVLDINYRSSKNVVEFVNKNFDDLDNYEYYCQKVNSDIQGLVEIINFEVDKDEPYKQIANKIDELLEKGLDVNNIAILTYTNADVLNLYLYLKQIFPEIEITTEMTSKLISEPNIQAIINAIKYLYFQEDLYRTNFNTLIGQDFQTLWDAQIIYTNISISELIKNIADTFNLMDQNIIKFIELASSYENIVDFIYEIDNLDASRVFNDKSGIQILTVFKAKGLEFDTVLVLDRIKRKTSDRGALLFEYDEIKLQNIFHKSSGRENFDENYADAIFKEKKLSIDDERNILYVALTRAKNNMFIFKKNKNSVFDLLGKNCNYQHLGQLYIDNNHSKITKIKNKIEINYKPLNLGYQAKQIKKETSNHVNLKAKYFGIATHYCLEMMNEFNQDSLNKSIHITNNKFSTFLDAQDFDDIYERVKLLINDTKFQMIIKNCEYFKEQTLVFDEQVKIIDLLLKQKDKYIICDYKTTIAQKDEHILQVQMYKKAIINITKTDDVKAFVIYLHKEKINIIEY